MTIGDGSYIGINAVIGGNVKIEKYSVIVPIELLLRMLQAIILQIEVQLG